LIFPVLFSLLAPQGSAVCLVKPQFEAGRERLGKKGVVRDPKVHSAVLGEVLQAARQQGFFAHGLSFSPITGADGNREYLLLLKKEPPAEGFSLPEAAAVVQAAIGVLGA
jgi:23S rRNA (cytidine1920-2'-O)/16S rRNA (cytidine1409-2'-O)-methyltransferase